MIDFAGSAGQWIMCRMAATKDLVFVLVLLVSLEGGLHSRTAFAAASQAYATGLCAEVVVGNGYPCIEHTVQTADGFLLGLQNIPYGAKRSDSASRPSVFLQHGVTQGGDDWLLNSPKESLGYVMADAGFDVWIGNSRNTRWSHGHSWLSNDSAEYWDWTWDELAAYDLPASLSYIYQHRKNTKLYYVGHSQGTLTVLAALSKLQSGVADTLQAVALLAPIAYLVHVTSTVIRVAADLYIDQIVADFGISEFSVDNPAGKKLISLVCSTQGVDCSDFIAAITGHNCCFNDSRIPYYVQFEPQPTSVKNMAHYAQMIRSGTLTKYDYGPQGNQENYNQSTPPPYDLTQIDTSVPMFISYGGQDALADPQDVTVGLLPQVSPNREVEVLYLPSYAHADHPFGTRAYIDVYPQLISFFQAHVLDSMHHNTRKVTV